MERRELLFSGMVQGVGFRYTARAVARNHQVSGFVRNLPDGRVQMVLEGETADIERYLAGLREHMGTYIRDTRETRGPATGEFDSFEVRF